MITYNNKEKTESLAYENQLAMFNLRRCISFVGSLDINDKISHDFDKQIEEYLILKNLKEDLDFAIDNDLSVCVANVDYVLVKKWCRLNLEFYKRHFLNGKEF